MNNQGKRSRVDKFDKRRKNTKAISILLIIGSILILVLISMFLFGNKDKEELEEPTNEITIKEEEEENTDQESDGSDSNDPEREIDDNEDNNDMIDNEEVETEQIESSDENVIEAYTGNWKPIGTEQSEPHTTVFEEESQDWKEMENAARYATGLDEMTTLWIGNDGEQKAVATISSTDQSEIYRVSLSWISEEGWQPTKVERLKKSDR